MLEDEKRAVKEGSEAYYNSENFTENPYYGESDELADQWHYGWCIAGAEDK